ncbi:MAG: hypothetical protein KC493_07080 [Bacteriovoracaceae bacterium]|nr:hypothetical protein [Bacteriovoracaceae bacterium]
MKPIILLLSLILSAQSFAQLGENDDRDMSPDKVVESVKGKIKRKRVNRAKWLVDHFSKNFATEVEETIFRFNMMRIKPKKIVSKIFPKSEHEIMFNLLKASSVRSFPEIKYEEGRYFFTWRKKTLHFNSLDAFQRQFRMGKHVFSYKGMHDVREMVIHFERFLRKHKFKKTSFLDTLITPAHADFFCDKLCLSGVVIGAVVAGGMYPIKTTMEKSEIRKEVRAMGKMKKQVSGRVNKCKNDLKKNLPKVMEKTSLENLAPGKFTSFNIIVQLLTDKFESEEKKLGGYIYKSVTSNSIGNCGDFSKFLVQSLSDVENKSGVQKIMSGICSEHREMVSCLSQFAGYFKSYQGGRYFGKRPKAIGVPFQVQ